jgi:hypothetical protein
MKELCTQHSAYKFEVQASMHKLALAGCTNASKHKIMCISLIKARRSNIGSSTAANSIGSGSKNANAA